MLILPQNKPVSSSTIESLGLILPMLTECVSTTVTANPNRSFTTGHPDAKIQLQDVLYGNCFQVASPRSHRSAWLHQDPHRHQPTTNLCSLQSISKSDLLTHKSEQPKDHATQRSSILSPPKSLPLPFLLLSTDVKKALTTVKREYQKREAACWSWSAQPAG